MAELARKVEVRRRGGTAELLIDGESFPWLIADDGVSINIVKGDVMPSVRVEVLAERVVIDDAVEQEPHPGG